MADLQSAALATWLRRLKRCLFRGRSSTSHGPVRAIEILLAAGICVKPLSRLRRLRDSRKVMGARQHAAREFCAARWQSLSAGCNIVRRSRCRQGMIAGDHIFSQSDAPAAGGRNGPMSHRTSVEIPETENELIAKAQSAVSRCNWVVGECAAKWTRKYAKGRTDADFGGMTGLTGDQVYQRRRVWEIFSDVSENYPALKWSHFYVALNWDDAPECLQWAQENDATVAEMRAWRQAARGDESFDDTSGDEWGIAAAFTLMPQQLTAVRDPDELARGEGRAEAIGASASPRQRGEAVETVAGVARESADGSDYAPFRKGAGSPPPQSKEADVSVIEKPADAPSAEQLVKRMTSALERMNAALSPEMLKQVRKLPDKLKSRFVKAVSDLGSKAAGLV